MRGRCLSWVKLGSGGDGQSCLFYPQQQTLLSSVVSRLSKPVPADCAPYCRANLHPGQCGRLDHSAPALWRGGWYHPACICRTIGSTFDAKASAAFRFVATPFACASRRLVRFPRTVPCAWAGSGSPSAHR